MKRPADPERAAVPGIARIAMSAAMSRESEARPEPAQRYLAPPINDGALVFAKSFLTGVGYHPDYLEHVGQRTLQEVYERETQGSLRPTDLLELMGAAQVNYDRPYDDKLTAAC